MRRLPSHMDLPRFTVIIPMLKYRREEPVLASLRENRPLSGRLQIIVAVGQHPARQRNAALAKAKGAFVLFFDNDCWIDSNYWRELEMAFSKSEVEIVGGPARLRQQASAWERIFHVLLTHTLIVGTVSARYSPRGQFRIATGTDLILCNLAVRRETFTKIGPLSTELYPNEENEWLDRARVAGVGAFYDPALQIFRPQRDSPAQFGWALLRYGMGRTRQFRVSGWRFTFHQMLPILTGASFLAVVIWGLEMEFVCLWLLASLLIALSCGGGLRPGERLVAGLIAPLLPLTYTLGQALGWYALASRKTPPGEIELLDEEGRALPQTAGESSLTPQTVPSI